MNFYFNYRMNRQYMLYDNIDLNKLIKSIKTLNKINKIFKLEKCSTSDENDDQIYIFIENNQLTINYSHLLYDGYSIFLILEKIDQIYKNEIENYKFKIYNSKPSFIASCYNNIKMLNNIKSNLNYENIYTFFFKKINKKTIKIVKTKFNILSSKEIIHHVVDKLGIRDYCLVINARKIYKEYENVLGNLIYFSNTINKNQDIKSVLENDKKSSLEKKLNNTIPNALLINSYVQMIAPSFVKHVIVPTPPRFKGKYMTIQPINNDKKYVVVDYYH